MIIKQVLDKYQRYVKKNGVTPKYLLISCDLNSELRQSVRDLPLGYGKWKGDVFYFAGMKVLEVKEDNDFIEVVR